MANDATKVSVGKPKVGGAIYRAPAGTALPTDATTALDAAYKCLGYVSEDGFKNTPTINTSPIKAWGGDVVLNPETEKSETFGMKLIEVLNVDVLKAVYNDSNVSGTLSTGITVRVNSKESEEAIYVCDMIMTGGVLKRVVVPRTKITAIAEIDYQDSDAVGYDITLQAMPGGFAAGDDDTHKEYIIEQ